MDSNNQHKHFGMSYILLTALIIMGFDSFVGDIRNVVCLFVWCMASYFKEEERMF
jgi:hypothetical protein